MSSLPPAASPALLHRAHDGLAAKAPPATTPTGARAVGRWLLAVLLAAVAIAAAAVGTALALGEPAREALRATSLLQAHRLRAEGGMDSWGPMWSALARWREDATRSPYAAALALDRCKFQYPPASWLLLRAMPAPEGQPLACTADGPPGRDIHTAAWAAKPWIALASSLACLGLVALSLAVAVQAWRAGAGVADGAPLPLSKRQRWGLGLAGAFAGLAFYPLMKGHTLGQLQVFINLALGAALWLVPRAPGTSGALVGVCCLFKPQYALFLAWGAWRRQGRFALGAALVAVAGHGAALALDGIGLHLQYLALLQSLSHVGEVFWANQSLNGVLNRWAWPAEAAQWAPAAFPPYRPEVRWGTLAGSLALLGLALWRPAGRPASVAPGASTAPTRAAGRAAPAWSAAGAVAAGAPGAAALVLQVDFALMLAALTMASPIAWEHHYGGFLPVFALLLGLFAAQSPWPQRSAVALGVAFVLMGNAVLRPPWFFAEPGQPWRGLLGAHLWVGALVVFALLIAWRARLMQRTHLAPPMQPTKRPKGVAP